MSQKNPRGLWRSLRTNLEVFPNLGPIFPELFFGRKLRGSFFPGVVFAKGCEFLLVSRGEGSGVRFRWVGGGFLVKNEGKKGKGVGRVGGVVGTGKGTGKSMRMRL